MGKITVLVAGGAGFIGSNLCSYLLAKGYPVVCVDNFLTGREANIENLTENRNFRFVKCDVANKDDVAKIDVAGISYIYHLASPASPVQYQKYPLETLFVNSNGTYNLLELAVKYTAKFLFASTSEVYGDPSEHPQKETYWGNVNSFGPRACYDEAKRFGEALVYTYLTKENIDARVIRIFNTYGPHMEVDDGRVISNFITQALQNQDITIYGDGSQTRSFCYVDDMVRGIVAAMEGERTRGEVINIGNPDERTMKEIAEKIKTLTGASVQIVLKERPLDDPQRRQPDITKAKTALNWTPTISLDDGLVKTIDYFRSVLPKTS